MDDIGQKIIKVFRNMEYCEIENTNNIAKKWLDDQMNTDTFKSLMQKSESNLSKLLLDSSRKALESWHNLTPLKRRQTILNLNKSFDANSELISQLDANIRNVLKSETKNLDLPVIKSSFEYYSTWPERFDGKLELKIDHIFVDIPCSPLILSWLIAPALAIGHAVIIHSTEKFLPLACLFVELSQQAFSSSSLLGLINVVNCKSSGNEDLFLKHFVTDYNISNQDDIQLSQALHSLGPSIYSIMVVYETADIDSAVQTAVDWSNFNFSKVPWCIRRIFVQESIFEEFEKKLTYRLNLKKYNCSDIIKDGIEEAQNLGLKTINNFLIVGGVVPTTEGVLCLSSFRTVKESLTLIQSTPNLAFASIWTESGSVAQYIIRKMKIGIIWVNCHGRFSSMLPFTLLKQCSSFGTFGGDPILPAIIPSKNIQYPFNEDYAYNINKIVLKTISASNLWQSVNLTNKIHKLLSLTDIYIPISNIKSWLELNEHTNIQQNQVQQIYSPLGIIVFPVKEYNENIYSDILDALIMGNAIIICSDNNETLKFKEALIKANFPEGLVTCLKYENLPYLMDHGDIDFIWGSFSSICSKSIKSRISKVSYSKVIWIPDDQVFAN